ncbi:uroporphyrinogen-III synthase [Anaerobacillus sp. HL2]|nr:uroporphyrinogen-III synthase [Anaerobacillus sp. HL2]
MYQAIKNKEIDVVTFTSSSTVENFIAIIRRNRLERAL